MQKCHSQATATCDCGATIKLDVSYEHAELMESQLPVAKMRLEALARDVQESYCHHQHLALLTHCQVKARYIWGHSWAHWGCLRGCQYKLDASRRVA